MQDKTGTHIGFSTYAAWTGGAVAMFFVAWLASGGIDQVLDWIAG